MSSDIICFQELMYPATRYVPRGYRRVSWMNISYPIYVRKGLKAWDRAVAMRWNACTVAGIRIISIHSSWEKEIMNRTVEQVNAQLTGRDVACGDWNVGLAALNKAGLQMQSARAQLGLPEEDTFINFTRPQQSHGAIDHFFLNGSLTPVSYRMVTDTYGCAKLSDHYPIVLEVSYPAL